MTRTAVWCFKVKDEKSRNRFSRLETMRGISQSYQNLCLKRGTWSADEDQMLKAYIKRHGIWNWNEMPKAAGLLRSGKSCRLRWMNYLRPNLKRGNFSKEEVQTMIELHKILGNRWSAMAAKLPGRTDNEIKNYWNCYLRNRFNNNISNTAAQGSKLQGTHASEEESKQKKSSKIAVSLLTTNILNSEDYSSKGTLPMSPILSANNFSSSSSNHVNYINENQFMEENVGSLESFGETSLWGQPFSKEAQMCKVEDYGETYTDEMWVQELLYCPVASHSFECKQRNSTDIDVPLPNSPKTPSEEFSSNVAFPLSPILSTDNFSSPSSNSVNDINENQLMEENVGSLESFGELSLWDQLFSMDAQMCKVEDYGETFTDDMWVQEFLHY